MEKQIFYGLEVPDNLHLSFPSKNSYDGWEYGFGIRSEYLFKGFMPRFNYSMYWTDFDGGGKRELRSEEVGFNLGYNFILGKTWMKNLTLRAGVVYSKIKFNYQNTLFIQPYFSFSEDASVIAFTVFTARLKGMDVKYTDGKFVCASEKVAERFNPWLEEKKEKGFNKMDHTFIATTLDALEAWNMSFGFEVEIYRNCFCTVDAHFLGNKNISMTTGLSFRLFGQK